jgi:hypothetical protein
MVAITEGKATENQKASLLQEETAIRAGADVERTGRRQAQQVEDMI